MTTLQDGKPAPRVEKEFIPLENNPVVFTHLARKLGISPDISFHDVYSLDEPSLLAMIPRPVLAILFTCPGNVYHRTRDEEVSRMETYTGSGEVPIMWFKQTIRESCGLMALLHAICNGEGRHHIQRGSLLDELRAKSIPLSVDGRGELLESSQALEDAHAEAAQMGDTAAPAIGDDVPNHFICFVKGDDGHVWELNGGIPGPADRGALAPAEDMLSEAALRASVRPFLDNGDDDSGYSIVVLASSRH